jgi:hypothetical protein
MSDTRRHSFNDLGEHPSEIEKKKAEEELERFKFLHEKKLEFTPSKKLKEMFARLRK